MNAAERVARGAALLDAHVPGWAARVTLTLLDMSDPFTDVLGQLYGQYGAGLRALRLSEEGAGDCGFLLVGYHAGRPVAWADLNGLWAAEVRSRLGSSAA